VPRGWTHGSKIGGGQSAASSKVLPFGVGLVCLSRGRGSRDRLGKGSAE